MVSRLHLPRRPAVLLMLPAALAVAAVTVGLWPAAEDPAVAQQAAAAARQAQAWRTAAAAVCATGCDEHADPPTAPPAPTALAAPDDRARPGPGAAPEEAPALPQDLDAWALHPGAPPVVESAAPRRWHNVPEVPDESDPTPADESDPYEAAPVEAPPA